MSSTQETGHAKNIANFRSLIDYCVSYGAKYNPVNPQQKIANLNTLLAASKTALKNSLAAEAAFDEATNNRMDATRPFSSLSTQIINALGTCGAGAETVKDAKAIHRKIQGRRATPKPPKPAPGSIEPTDKTISASQTSYDQQVSHFTKLVELLRLEEKYIPNEDELKLATLEILLVSLEAQNDNVGKHKIAWKKSRNERNELMYKPLTGLVATAQDVKKYVKSVYKSAQEFKQVSILEFRTIKE